jgi:ComF family protein
MGDEAREIVHHLKYEGYTKLAELAASAIAQRIHTVPRGAILVPIPLGARRRFERGYNQATEIALALSRLWSLQVSESVIRRRRETASQTALTPEERVQNVTAAFKAIHPVTAGSNVAILVDDVLTTGATIASGASALLEAGWEEVRAVTFARALPFVVRMEVQS